MKHEIIVKPLIWTEYKWQIVRDRSIQTVVGYSNDQNYRIIEQNEHGGFMVLRVSILNNDGLLFKSECLEECQAWVQMKWNKYALSLIKVK